MAAVAGGWDWLEQHGQLGDLPTLDFPEISMFGRCPWGGSGANPSPGFMQHDWETHGRLIAGGIRRGWQLVILRGHLLHLHV